MRPDAQVEALDGTSKGQPWLHASRTIGSGVEATARGYSSLAVIVGLQFPFRDAPMTYSSYYLRQMIGPVWVWEANYRDEVHTGHSIGKGAAQRAARNWLRAQRQHNAQQRNNAVGPGGGSLPG